MSTQFWTGFFTLLGSFGGIWLKDHLEVKKSSKTNLKQKALEAYTITDDLPNAQNQNSIACKNLLQNRQFNTSEMLKNFPDTTAEQLKKLELLIIENFSDLNTSFIQLKKIIIDHSLFLYSIICSNAQNLNITEESFLKTQKDFESNVILASHTLKNRLENLYMNKNATQPNFFALLVSFKVFLINFFKLNKKSE